MFLPHIIPVILRSLEADITLHRVIQFLLHILSVHPQPSRAACTAGTASWTEDPVP